jgi:hypothetical protein
MVGILAEKIHDNRFLRFAQHALRCERGVAGVPHLEVPMYDLLGRAEFAYIVFPIVVGSWPGLAPLGVGRLLVHDRDRMLADLACAIADGAEVISDLRVMGAQAELFGLVASIPTLGARWMR